MEKIRRFLGGNPRVWLLRILGRFHFALPLALITAGVYEALGWDAWGGFLRSLLFVVPMAASYYAIHKIGPLGLYLVFSLALAGVSWLLIGNPGAPVVLLLVCLLRARFRLSEEKGESYMDVPFFSVLAFYVLAFLISAFADLHVLQRLSVLCAAVYFLICIVYYGVRRLNDYLVLNRDMSNLPARRIQRTAGAAILAMVVLSGAMLLPVALRNTGDLHLEIPDKPFSESETEAEPEAPSETVPNMGAAFSDEYWGSSWQIPAFVSYTLFCVIGIALLMLVVSVVFQIFKNFRITFTDSRDVVQYLQDPDQDTGERAQRAERTKPRLWDRSPNAQVRRKYRKEVLRSANGSPERWQTPAEVEAAVGLEDAPLHALYEKARYGNEPCTAEDLQRIRR